MKFVEFVKNMKNVDEEDVFILRTDDNKYHIVDTTEVEFHEDFIKIYYDDIESTFIVIPFIQIKNIQCAKKEDVINCRKESLNELFELFK